MGRERERERQTDRHRETDRQTETDRFRFRWFNDSEF